MTDTQFDWSKSCAYDTHQKRLFHMEAHGALYRLARSLPIKSPSNMITHNAGGNAVSGEITLHADTVYVQVAQWAIGHGMGILVRTVTSRRDYTGGRNHHLPLALLSDVDKLARVVRALMEPGRKPWDPLPCLRAVRGGYTYELIEGA